MVVDSVCLASSCFSIASDLDSRSFLVSLILMASVMAALVASGARRRLAGDGCRLGVLGVELLLDRVDDFADLERLALDLVEGAHLDQERRAQDLAQLAHGELGGDP